MEWLDNDIVVAIIAFLSSATGTALIAYFARNVIRNANKLFGDKNGELENLKKTNADLIKDSVELTKQVAALVEREKMLFEITKVAFMNDPKYVTNGTAKKIAEILEKGGNK